jgi:hypothetical protein
MYESIEVSFYRVAGRIHLSVHPSLWCHNRSMTLLNKMSISGHIIPVLEYLGIVMQDVQLDKNRPAE